MSTERLEELIDQLEAVKNREKAEPMSAYMRYQFPFLGVQTPTRRKVTNALFKKWNIKHKSIDWDFIFALWEKDEREYQFVAVDYLIRMKQKLMADDLKKLKELILTKSWWDTVDAIASRLVGHIVLLYPETVKIMDQWINDENMWIRRTVILHQLSYKEQTNEERLFRYCTYAYDNEFFIAKAIGWALRQYAKTSPNSVRNFVQQTELQSLSRREALKHLNKS